MNDLDQKVKYFVIWTVSLTYDKNLNLAGMSKYVLVAMQPKTNVFPGMLHTYYRHILQGLNNGLVIKWDSKNNTFSKFNYRLSR